MEDSVECYESLLQQGANRLKGQERRLFMAEVTLKLCNGNARKAERRFGWGRETVDKGLHEFQQGVRCLENFSARGRPRLEDKIPQLAQDIRAIVEPHTQADPELKSARRYSNLSAANVLEALQTKKGYPKENLPGKRTMRDILNRMNYRLKRIRKGKPLKKTPQTNAIFANVKAVKAEIKGPDTLEISMDTKAKVNEGDYARGGKKPDRRGRRGREGLGS
jgi:transposase